jgi:hypothetical protein
VPISYAGRTYDEGKKIRARHALGVLGMFVKQRVSSVFERDSHRDASAEEAQKPAHKSNGNGKSPHRPTAPS